MPLSEQRRGQLDQIVVKMASQNAPKEDVEAIVNDFKSKFGNEGGEVPLPNQQPQAKPGILKRAASTVNDLALGASKGAWNTFTGTSDLGSKIFDPILNKVGIDTSQAGTASQVIPKELRTPENTTQDIGFGLEQLGEFFAPAGIAAKVEKAAQGSKLLAKAPSVLQKGAGLLARAGTEAITSGGQTLMQGGSGEDALKNAAVSAALPLAGSAANGILSKAKKYTAENIAPRMINRILKPNIKEFNFGRNPGAAVVNEGITANTKEALLDKISSRKKEVGQEIDRLLTSAEGSVLNSGKTIDIAPLLKPIDDAMQSAVEGGEQGLYSRLQGIKDGLTKQFTVQDGRLVAGAPKNLVVTPKEAAQIKRGIGDASKWTGQAFDDDANQVRVKVYRNINDAIEKAVPGIKKVNGRYANLLGAEKSLEKTISTAERQRMLGIGDLGVGAALGLGSALQGDGISPKSVLTGVAGAALSRGLKSPALQTRLTQGLYKASTKEPNLLPKIGKAAKNLYLSQSFDRK